MASAMQRSAIAKLPQNQALKRAVLRQAPISRTISTQVLSAEEAQEQLNKKRNLRPNSPWMIYEKQLTSATSLANRGTGVGMSGGFYALFLAHLAAPLVGIEFGSETMLSLWESVHPHVQTTVKSIVALPFTYHVINGFRHLAWDTGFLLDLKKSYIAAYSVMAASVASAAALVAWF
ncbi:hypothetical protein MNV49_002779 [Pseudohyphozyma bogoriensis]|nr:hypothetical protein MNV49_002779 [Pseudohyphozyma bogoriensis]